MAIYRLEASAVDLPVDDDQRRLAESLSAESVEVWRNAYDLLDLLPVSSIDHAEIAKVVIDMQAVVALLRGATSEATTRSARHTVDLGRLTVAVVAGRLPIDIEAEPGRGHSHPT